MKLLSAEMNALLDVVAARAALEPGKPTPEAYLRALLNDTALCLRATNFLRECWESEQQAKAARSPDHAALS